MEWKLIYCIILHLQVFPQLWELHLELDWVSRNLATVCLYHPSCWTQSYHCWSLNNNCRLDKSVGASNDIYLLKFSTYQYSIWKYTCTTNKNVCRSVYVTVLSCFNSAYRLTSHRKEKLYLVDLISLMGLPKSYWRIFSHVLVPLFYVFPRPLSTMWHLQCCPLPNNICLFIIITFFNILCVL